MRKEWLRSLKKINGESVLYNLKQRVFNRQFDDLKIPCRISFLTSNAFFKKFLLLCLIFWTSIFTHAEQVTLAPTEINTQLMQEIHFNNFSSSQSMLHPIIYDIVQDLNGFIWIGTQDGLYRYDGNDFKRYGTNIEQQGSLSSHYINALHADNNGRIWVATRNGINLFYPELNTFKEFSKKTHPKAFLGKNYIAITEDQQGNLWFASKQHGLTFYDVGKNEFTTYLTNENDATSISSNKIFDVTINKDNVLLVGTDNGLNIKYPQSEEFTRVNRDSKKKLPFNNVHQVFESKSGKLWLGNLTEGLALYSLDNGLEQVFTHQGDNPTTLCSNTIMDIIEDSNNTLWVATDKGLCQYFAKTASFKRHLHQTDRLTSLVQDWVNVVFQDRGGVLWVGTNSGLSNWNAQLNRFLHISKNLGTRLSSNIITAFAENNQQQIYLGTWGGGINLYSPQDQQTIEHQHIDKVNLQLEDMHVGSLLSDSQNRLWIGTSRQGLYLVDGISGSIQHFIPDDEDSASIGSKSITKLVELNDGSIAVGTFGHGVNIYQENSQFSPLAIKGSSGLLDQATIYDIKEDEQGSLWIATENNGVVNYNRKTQELIQFIGLQKGNNKPANMVYALLNTKKYLWTATQDAGIGRLNKSKFYQGIIDYQTVHSSENITINSAYGLLEGDRGFVWAAHGRGISRIHPEELSLTNFNKSHNLQGLDFNVGANFKASSGEMYFGGVNGFNAISGDKIPLNSYAPELKLLEFSIFNEPVAINSVLNTNGELILKHSDSVIGFEFAALDYTQPEKNQYQYQMVGLSERWVNLKDNRITFSNLSDGVYTLLIKGSNNDGVWSEAPLEINIVVQPPFWRTITAYVIYALIGLTILYLIYRRQIRKINAQKKYQAKLKTQVEERTIELKQANEELEKSMAETEKAKDIAESAAKAKADFLATMSHEIRTPMNSILGMNELLLKTKLSSAQKKYASMAFRSGESLLALINDILDFSKMEDNKITLEKVRFELPKLVEDCVYLLRPVQAENPVKVIADIDPNCPKFIKGDELRYRQIITNLLSNAIKFTKQGSVIVKVEVVNNELHMAVIDTGIGIPQEKQQHIFDAFEQADSSTTRRFGGTGLGLSITKKLVDLMQGEINLTSQLHGGSTFRVVLPLELTDNEINYLADKNDISKLDLNVIADAKIALIAMDRPVVKRAKEGLQKLQLNFQHINNSEHIFNFISGKANEVLLMDEEMLEHLDWQIKLRDHHNHIICMSDSSESIDHTAMEDICFIDKVINIKELYSVLAEKVSSEEIPQIVDESGERNPQFNARVLLVEDAYTNQIVATEMLNLFGCDVDVAEHGLEAFNKVREEDYDIIFMDCQMPVMDGFEATRKIRLWQEVQGQSPALIIALTAGKGVGYLEECLGVGMDDFMLKPFNFNQLHDILDKHLSHLAEQSPIGEGDAVIDAQEVMVNELIDLANLDSIFQIEKSTGRKIFPKLLDTFKQEMQIKMPELMDAYLQQNSTSLYRTAHAIKSSAGNVGAVQLVNLCQVIEKAGLNNDFLKCSNELKVIQKIYDQTVEQLAEL